MKIQRKFWIILQHPRDFPLRKRKRKINNFFKKNRDLWWKYMLMICEVIEYKNNKNNIININIDFQPSIQTKNLSQ